MKRVLIFSLAYLPRHIGGAEIAIKEITDRVVRSDFEFHMITNRYDASLPKIEQIGNVLVHRIGFVRKNPSMADLRRFPLHLNKMLYQFSAALYALRLHLKYRYDGIWAMMAHATGVPAVIFNMVFPRVPFLLTLQEGDPPETIERTMRPLWPLFVRAFTRATLVQSLSSFLEAWSIRRGAARTVVIPNGVALQRFRNSVAPEQQAAVRAQLGMEMSDVVVVTISRLVPKNGIDTVIDALPALPAHVHFLILGTGPAHDALEAQAQARGVAERTHFYGEASQEDIPRLLAASNVFIRASRSEGQGIAFIEAMAAGMPTIGTRVGGIVDFIKDGDTGYLIEPNDASAVAGVLTRIMEHQEEAARIAERGKALIRERYDWNRIVQDMQERCFSIF